MISIYKTKFQIMKPLDIMEALGRKPCIPCSKRPLAALGALALTAGAAFAGSHSATLSGDLKIFSDMSNPAPRAVMEDMVERFGAMHPDLNIELTVIDREAYKTQIRNFLTANPPDVANWYAANRMRPYVDAGLFEDISDLWAEPRSPRTWLPPKAR